jgi:hypothetical protein
MIVDDFDMRWSSLIPDKADPPLIIDPNRMLSPTVRSECFEPIARGHSKFAEHPGLIQKTKLSKRDVLDISRQFSAPTAGPDQLCFGIGEALNHPQI